jgi:hypothetical protein
LRHARCRHRHIISDATTAFATLAPLFAGFRRRLDFHWLLPLMPIFAAAFSHAASSMPSFSLRTIITLPFHAAFDVGFIFQFSLLIFSPSFFRYAMIARRLPIAADRRLSTPPFSLMLLFAIIFADDFATIFAIIFRLLTSR